MLRIPDRPLPEAAAERLQEYQQAVDTVIDYADRVAEARKRFKSRNRMSDPAFRVVRETLRAMCSDTDRCMYCEDSLANEVEHFKPKALYPEAVFFWANFLYACGPCNSRKGSRFWVYPTGKDQSVDVTRRTGADVLAPVPGEPVLIDPRLDEPLDLLALDLQDTFRFMPRAPRGTRPHERAELTIEVLGLNDRDVLPGARRTTFVSLRALLERYVQKKEGGASAEALARITTAIVAQPHPTVWAEMKRQRQPLGLDRLFEHSPEALEW